MNQKHRRKLVKKSPHPWMQRTIHHPKLAVLYARFVRLSHTTARRSPLTPTAIMVVCAGVVIFTFILINTFGHDADATSPDVDPNHIVLSYAGQSITWQALHKAEIDRAQALVHQHAYTATLAQEQAVTTYAIDNLIDHIQMNSDIASFARTHLAFSGAAVTPAWVQQVAPLSAMSAADGRTFYEHHQEIFRRPGMRLHIAEIVLSDAHTVTKVQDQLQQGASFIDLARKYSIDPPLYTANGGDLGWVQEGSMPLEWEAAAFSLRAGQTSPAFTMAGNTYLVKILEGPRYDVVPASDVTPSVQDIAAHYLQAQAVNVVLSQHILAHPPQVVDAAYQGALNQAMAAMAAAPEQPQLNPYSQGLTP